MDFSKAFASIPRNWLPNKLKRHGNVNKTDVWIEDRVMVSGEHSPWTHARYGVPKGAVEGPLLFLISTPQSVCLQMTVYCTDKLQPIILTINTERPR